jgi:hypothetical protein
MIEKTFNQIWKKLTNFHIRWKWNHVMYKSLYIPRGTNIWYFQRGSQCGPSYERERKRAREKRTDRQTDRQVATPWKHPMDPPLLINIATYDVGWNPFRFLLGGGGWEKLEPISGWLYFSLRSFALSLYLDCGRQLITRWSVNLPDGQMMMIMMMIMGFLYSTLHMSQCALYSLSVMGGIF